VSAIWERSDRWPPNEDRADRLALSPHRHGDDAPKPRQSRQSKTLSREDAGGFGVGQLDDGVLVDGATRDEGRSHGRWIGRSHLLRLGIPGIEAHQAHQAPVMAIDGTQDRAAERHRAPNDRVEYRLDIGRGARNDPEDLARGSLSVQRSGEIVIARFELREEPHVFDRNDGLIREGLEQCNLPVGERPWRAARHGQRPNRPTVAK